MSTTDTVDRAAMWTARTPALGGLATLGDDGFAAARLASHAGARRSRLRRGRLPRLSSPVGRADGVPPKYLWGPFDRWRRPWSGIRWLPRHVATDRILGG